ncbi:unnamed protein product [Protopolystoma xenopodis]|uniref:Uncharacterized protein n=1 Tax=Protopolystoma xenopodis TaxID=117903 RepID=A0A448WN24_9PLAT|nr:unnamed protein product [Protopolystoma xenopodis]
MVARSHLDALASWLQAAPRQVLSQLARRSNQHVAKAHFSSHLPTRPLFPPSHRSPNTSIPPPLFVRHQTKLKLTFLPCSARMPTNPSHIGSAFTCFFRGLCTCLESCLFGYCPNPSSTSSNFSFTSSSSSSFSCSSFAPLCFQFLNPPLTGLYFGWANLLCLSIHY